MQLDPIVEEVRKIRDEYAKRFNYDLDAICHESNIPYQAIEIYKRSRGWAKEE